jgi:hypothetical protein
MNAEQERHELRHADQADRQRGAREPVDLVRQRDDRHLVAEARHELPDEEQAKVATAQWSDVDDQSRQITSTSGKSRPSCHQIA